MPLRSQSVVTPSISPEPLATRAVRARWARVLARATVCVAGDLKRDPSQLLRRYPPSHTLSLFGTEFFLTTPRQIPELRFLLAYLVQPTRQGRRVYPRIFYKDLSLVWRVASHIIDCEGEFWVGKGAVSTEVRDGYEYQTSDESSTDLPFELQTALEVVNGKSKQVPRDDRVLRHVLRRAPQGRMHPYRDFSAPRALAAKDPARRVHDGKPVAWFKRVGDPSSLRFARGYAPNFASGVVERSTSKSSLYHGKIRRFRILSDNGRIQYFFFAGPRHAWLAPPQTLEPIVGSYGVRLIAPLADDDLFVPGYEYHHVDPDVDASEHFSQIPDGYAGAASEVSPDRADASAWLDALPVIEDFRRHLL